MKKKTLKILKKISREMAPASKLKARVMPSRRRKLIEKALLKASKESAEDER